MPRPLSASMSKKIHKRYSRHTSESSYDSSDSDASNNTSPDEFKRKRKRRKEGSVKKKRRKDSSEFSESSSPTDGRHQRKRKKRKHEKIKRRDSSTHKRKKHKRKDSALKKAKTEDREKKEKRATQSNYPVKCLQSSALEQSMTFRPYLHVHTSLSAAQITCTPDHDRGKGAPLKRNFAPMTKEQYEKEQSVLRRVFDPETGRNRLVKGDGEIVEEIVSRDRHRAINKLATEGDGRSFQAGLRKLN